MFGILYPTTSGALDKHRSPPLLPADTTGEPRAAVPWELGNSWRWSPDLL